MGALSDSAVIYRLLRGSVEVSTGCWEWSKSRNKAGYGVTWDGASTKLAHRLMWERLHGEALGELILRHSCDNPPCINPAHLSPGTHADNVQDRVDRSRSHRHWTRERRELLQELYEPVGTGHRGNAQELTEIFGVSASAIRQQYWRQRREFNG